MSEQYWILKIYSIKQLIYTVSITWVKNNYA